MTDYSGLKCVTPTNGTCAHQDIRNCSCQSNEFMYLWIIQESRNWKYTCGTQGDFPTEISFELSWKWEDYQKEVTSHTPSPKESGFKGTEVSAPGAGRQIWICFIKFLINLFPGKILYYPIYYRVRFKTRTYTQTQLSSWT